MTRLANKTAIITGAAGGIGLETSILFAKNGARVLMADVNPTALKTAVETVKRVLSEDGFSEVNGVGVVNGVHGEEKANGYAGVKGIVVEGVVCDVSKEADVEAMVKAADKYGGVDVMFNNAGIMHAKDDDAVNTPEDIWDLTQSINVKGVWFGCKHAVLSFRRNQKQSLSVINTASTVALMGAATPQLAYTTSKGAVLALTRELAIVHAKEGIRFNSLCPAPLNTPLLQDWLGDDQEKRLRRTVHFPMGRFGEAIEQAQAVVFLASEESGFVNGHEMVVDGGLTKAYVTAEGGAGRAGVNRAFGR